MREKLMKWRFPWWKSENYQTTTNYQLQNVVFLFRNDHIVLKFIPHLKETRNCCMTLLEFSALYGGFAGIVNFACYGYLHLYNDLRLSTTTNRLIILDVLFILYIFDDLWKCWIHALAILTVILSIKGSTTSDIEKQVYFLNVLLTLKEVQILCN